MWKKPSYSLGHVPRLPRSTLAGGWGHPPPRRWFLASLPLPERLLLPWGLLVGLDPKSTQFMERFLLRSTALVWVSAQRHSGILGVQSGLLRLHHMVREVRRMATVMAMPGKGQSGLNSFSTFPLLHFRDFYGKHICNVFNCIYAVEN